MNTKSYECICAVCGETHVVATEFLSAPRTLQARDGRSLPALSCGRHTRAEVVAAYEQKVAVMREP